MFLQIAKEIERLDAKLSRMLSIKEAILAADYAYIDGPAKEDKLRLCYDLEEYRWAGKLRVMREHGLESLRDIYDRRASCMDDGFLHIVIDRSELERFEIKESQLYLKNVSMDLDKVKELYPNTPIDPELRGVKSRTYSVVLERTPAPEAPRPVGEFHLGKFYGVGFEECEDFDYMAWYATTYGVTEVLERVLTEAGYVCIEELGNWVTEEEAKPIVLRLGAEAGHHSENGEKVELVLTEVEAFGFDGTYGYTHVITYVSDDNKLYKYVGGSPKEFNPGSRVKATIKHKEYNGQPETHLLRIKVLEEGPGL